MSEKNNDKLHSDNPNLSQASLFKRADDWTRAINAEMKQMKAVPYGKPWVPPHMILIRQRYPDGYKLWQEAIYKTAPCIQM